MRDGNVVIITTIMGFEFVFIVIAKVAVCSRFAGSRGQRECGGRCRCTDCKPIRPRPLGEANRRLIRIGRCIVDGSRSRSRRDT